LRRRGREQQPTQHKVPTIIIRIMGPPFASRIIIIIIIIIIN
jgi:hypothetical protein